MPVNRQLVIAVVVMPETTVSTVFRVYDKYDMIASAERDRAFS